MKKVVLQIIEEFRNNHKIESQGRLSMVLFLSRKAATDGLPIDIERLKTKGAGQISGASGKNVQKILAEYGINKKLSSEGGRTSRGSIKYAEEYVDVLNKLIARGLLYENELKEVEVYWIERIKDFFSKSFIKVPADVQLSISEIVRMILEEATERQKRVPGSTLVGTVLQHMVGAKLSLALGDVAIIHHSASTGDLQSSRAGDFVVGESAIHVTSAPSETLLQKCKENINAGGRPIIVCPTDKVQAASVLAENIGLRERIDIYAAESFISMNLNEIARFDSKKLKETTADFIRKYNEIISETESDQSLKFEIK